MSRLLGTAVLLLVLCFAAPAIAQAARAAVPSLASVVLFLVVLRLVWPARRRP